MKRSLLLALLALPLLTVVPATAADDAPDCASLDDLAALEAECEGRTPNGWAVGQHRDDALPRNCRLRNDVVFWTAEGWVALGQELAARQGECTTYYISIPPTANDSKVLRVLQDDLIRAHGAKFKPVAEMRLGTLTGWAAWVAADPRRTWFDAGVEFRRRMVDAGYDFSRGETWLLNEANRSTRLDEPPYTRQAIVDVVRGLAVGDGLGPVVPGILELGIQYSHQTMPDLTAFHAEMKSLVTDGAFWDGLEPYVSHFAREAYADARRWGVAGSSRHERTEHMNDYFQHLMELAENGPAEAEPARRFLRRTFTPFANATWPAQAPEDIRLSATCPAVYVCGHGSTQIPLADMLSFVSEEVFAIRHYAGSHPGSGPAGRIGFSWQPVTTNVAERRSIASRIAEAVRDAYGHGGGSPAHACGPPDTDVDWCDGADVPGAFFTDAWAEIVSWQ
jgi:hypothetical protein